MDSVGDDLVVSLLGLPEEEDWILYGPYSDKTLMRNVLGYELARQLGYYSSSTKFCEVVLNNEYMGLYVLMEKLKRDKDVGTSDIARRIVDFGVQEYFTSHHPWIVPEPFLPEPCDTYSKEDIDLWVAIIKHTCEEAYSNPEIVRNAPHNQPISKINEKALNDPDKWAMTWRAFLKKNKMQKRE